jgi:hypothetical protein
MVFLPTPGILKNPEICNERPGKKTNTSDLLTVYNNMLINISYRVYV